jgi:phosphatidylglycerophosphatase A
MIKLHKLIATFFGIGYVGKGGGTIAAAAICVIWLLAPDRMLTNLWQIVIVVVILVAGTWSGNVVHGIWGKDSSKVVIDEVAGMLITLLFLPVNLKYVISGLVLFRFFDIVKPFYIRKMELLPKGWGVMADDVLAGLYARLIMQLALILGLF